MKRFVLALALSGASLVSAAPGPFAGGWTEGKWWKNPRAVRELSLTSSQSDRIEEIFLKVRPTLIDLRAEMEKKRLQREAILERPNVDSKEAARAIDELGAARSKLDKARALMFLEIRQVLTPEQRDRILDRGERFRERRRSRSGRGPSGRLSGGPEEDFDEPH